MTDPTAAVWDILHPGRTLPPRPAVLPTDPGIYVARETVDLTTVSVWLLDAAGFWWHLNRVPATADEVSAAMHGRPLERLHRESEKDL